LCLIGASLTHLSSVRRTDPESHRIARRAHGFRRRSPRCYGGNQSSARIVSSLADGSSLWRALSPRSAAPRRAPRSDCLRPATSRGRSWIYRSSGQKFAARLRRSPSKGGSFSAARREKSPFWIADAKACTAGTWSVVKVTALRSSGQNSLPHSNEGDVTQLL